MLLKEVLIFAVVIFLFNSAIAYAKTVDIFKTKTVLIELNHDKLVSDSVPVVGTNLHEMPDGVGESESLSPSLKEIGEFTAYTPREEETDKAPLVMASGKKVYYGAIACPSRFNFGDKIIIENLGEFTCEDRMAERFRDGNYFDIMMFDYNEALEFGRKDLMFSL